MDGVLTITNSVRTITPERVYTKDEIAELKTKLSRPEQLFINDICKAFGGKLR